MTVRTFREFGREKKLHKTRSEGKGRPALQVWEKGVIGGTKEFVDSTWKRRRWTQRLPTRKTLKGDGRGESQSRKEEGTKLSPLSLGGGSETLRPSTYPLRLKSISVGGREGGQALQHNEVWKSPERSPNFDELGKKGKRNGDPAGTPRRTQTG